MNPDEVVMHVEDRERSGVILELLAVAVRQPGESAQRHSDGEVLSLHIRRGDVFGIGIPDNPLRFASDACSRRVPALAFRVDGPVDFDEHRVIDVFAESGIDGSQICFKPIAGQLDAIGEPSSEILGEFNGGFRITHPERVAGDQFRVRIDSDPSPDIADDSIPFDLLRRDILGFAANKAPNLIDLKPLAVQVAEMFVHVPGAGRAEFERKFLDRVLGAFGNPDGSADRAPVNQAFHDLSSLGNIEPVHMTNIAALKKRVN